jgi:hypothetical protein
LEWWVLIYVEGNNHLRSESWWRAAARVCGTMRCLSLEREMLIMLIRLKTKITYGLQTMYCQWTSKQHSI